MIPGGFLDKLVSRLDRLDPGSLQAHFVRLANEHGFLEAIFQSIQEGVLAIDSQGRLLYANRATEQMLGFEYAKMRGRSVMPLLHDLDWDRLLQATDVDEWSSMLTREIEVAYPEHRYISLYAVPLPGQSGSDETMVGPTVLVILRDITRDRAEEATTLESERTNAIKLLAAGVAHEIGNPLNALNIHLQLLARAIDVLPRRQRDDLGELVDVARTEVSRLDAIITQFLQAVRPQKPHFASCDIKELLQETLRLIKTEVENRRIGVAVEYPSEIPSVKIDRQQIKQVFFNLIKNALEAMPDGGSLKISLRATDAWLEAAFLDSGVGIDPEWMGRLFQPYQTTKTNGHGLGLMIVQRIIQEHGGQIEVASRPGEGSCFRILLPRASRRIRMLKMAPDHDGMEEKRDV